ncbi:MAG TPA: cobalt transporter CbiM, partial [Vicinamibacterales bacterium]|nr:cobalt transporter CbiM [Vicinamibacterales bacterium]
TSIPFWSVAMRRLKHRLMSRFVPLLSLFAAFSFVIMMFNLPLPGGTTGHAVGMGVATIVLGPSGSIIAISVALFIQAFFFGDGGITALGANCFNMAIVGSLVAWATYRLLSGCAPLVSPRRVIAAGLAGYTAINVAALCAAIEFGIQPLLFHDASGAPLYAPYPLRIAIPAMMIGHLTFAGLAEFIVSAGVVAYLQRNEPWLLKTTASDVDDEAPGAREQGTRVLWFALAALMILTPLGLLAVGHAWGEWSARDFADAAARSEIAAASGNVAPPNQAPRGMERLSAIWTAPFNGYAPPFLRSPGLGYAMSAMLGTGLVLLTFLLARLVVHRREPRSSGTFS